MSGTNAEPREIVGLDVIEDHYARAKAAEWSDLEEVADYIPGLIQRLRSLAEGIQESNAGIIARAKAEAMREASAYTDKNGCVDFCPGWLEQRANEYWDIADDGRSFSERMAARSVRAWEAKHGAAE